MLRIVSKTALKSHELVKRQLAISNENIIIIDSSEDEDVNTNQDIFVKNDKKVLIFAPNQ
ncbi:24502_t:CDS:2 [Cetraspora pellucida]|uniref:24502_t:CDS:1 n=1 Tax=Cetraspora pellucida TaxID=1433469 RepID=A0A9N9FBC0_9GLOM|nr:24502_t:CDS:2 [Cetraspora pellucida]